MTGAPCQGAPTAPAAATVSPDGDDGDDQPAPADAPGPPVPADVVAKYRVAMLRVFVEYGDEVLDAVRDAKGISVEDVREAMVGPLRRSIARPALCSPFVQRPGMRATAHSDGEAKGGTGGGTGGGVRAAAMAELLPEDGEAGVPAVYPTAEPMACPTAPAHTVSVIGDGLEHLCDTVVRVRFDSDSDGGDGTRQFRCAAIKLVERSLMFAEALGSGMKRPREGEYRRLDVACNGHGWRAWKDALVYLHTGEPPTAALALADMLAVLHWWGAGEQDEAALVAALAGALDFSRDLEALHALPRSSLARLLGCCEGIDARMRVLSVAWPDIDDVDVRWEDGLDWLARHASGAADAAIPVLCHIMPPVLVAAGLAKAGALTAARFDRLVSEYGDGMTAPDWVAMACFAGGADRQVELPSLVQGLTTAVAHHRSKKYTAVSTLVTHDPLTCAKVVVPRLGTIAAQGPRSLRITHGKIQDGKGARGWEHYALANGGSQLTSASHKAPHMFTDPPAPDSPLPEGTFYVLSVSSV